MERPTDVARAPTTDEEQLDPEPTAAKPAESSPDFARAALPGGDPVSEMSANPPAEATVVRSTAPTAPERDPADPTPVDAPVEAAQARGSTPLEQPPSPPAEPADDYAADPYHYGPDPDHEAQDYEAYAAPAAAAGPAVLEAGGGAPPTSRSLGRGRPEEEPAPEEEEDGGGPVKSFLEHLEDLRWVLIKSGVAVFIGFIVCLIAGNKLMSLLMWPLERTAVLFQPKQWEVYPRWGTNTLGVLRFSTNQLGSFGLGTNRQVVVDLNLVPLGTNHVVTVQLSSDQPTAKNPMLPIKLINLGPAAGFIVAFHLAVYGGIVLAAPFIIYFVAAFVVPALKRIERKYLGRAFVVGTGLFFTGVSFCYFLLLPLALNASANYSRWLGFEVEQWRAEEYISFVCRFMLGMGIGFQLPVVILFLVKLGILDYAALKKGRPYVVVINLVLGAVLTTPEVITQIMMFIPLQILYEISLWIAWYWEKRDQKRAQAAA